MKISEECNNKIEEMHHGTKHIDELLARIYIIL